MSATEASPPSLASDRAVAALLLAIDPERSARVLRGFTSEQLERVTATMRELRAQVVDRDDVVQVLATAVRRLGRAGSREPGSAPNPPTGPGVEAASGGVAVGDQSEPPSATARFAVFEALAPRDLATVLVGEHPQIGAVFLAHLDPDRAAAAVRMMSAEKQADLIYRIATLDRTPEDILTSVLEVMTKKVTELGLTTPTTPAEVWIQTAAALLNRLDETELAVLGSIAARDEWIAGSIRDEMFTFESIAQMDRKSVRRFLAETETRTLATALKGASEAVEENILSNLTKRAADMVAEQRDRIGPLRLSVVQAAQERILETIRGCVDRGWIARPGAVGEPLL